MTVTQRVIAIRREVRETPDLLPDRAMELLIQLTALYGNILDELRQADMDYNGVLLNALSGEEAANRARIRAQATPEYGRLRAAKDVEKEVLEMVRTLKAFTKSKAEEMRLSK